MQFIVLICLPAALLWSFVAVRRISLVALAALFFVTTACFPPEVFSFRAIGLSWTLDRFVVITLLATVALGVNTGRIKLLPLESVEYLACLFLLWLTARTITQPLGSLHPMQPHTLMHFINGYAVPFALYFALRCSVLEKKDLRPAFWIMMAMGVYLGVTAVLEIAKMSSLVFPKSINDPTLGIHFGRARGPMLQSVRLGVCLLVCLIIGIVYTICLNPWKRSRWAVAAIVVPVLTVAIGLTYTRSIWMGLMAVVGILIVLCLQGQLRRGLVIGGAMAGIFGGLILGPNLVAFKREYSAAETRESTYMRAAFAYVSFEMIKDRPVAGFGFNQFNIANRTYLSDRSTDIRVESIRGYVHHNSFLSLLVDLGIIGFSLFSFMMIGFVRESWRLWRSEAAPDYIRALGLVAICCTSVHLIQMAFHEVSFSPIENSILLGSFGLVMAAKRRYRDDQIGPGAAELENQLPSH